MRNILAIAHKELKSYFASPIAYMVIGLFALLYGYFFGHECDIQRAGHVQALTALNKSAGVVPPIRFVKVHGQKITAVIVEQRIDTNGVFACQMVVDDGVGEGFQQAVVAVAAFDAGFLANPGAPFVAAGRGVAGLARGLAFPANGIGVGAAVEQTAEKGDLVLG